MPEGPAFFQALSHVTTVKWGGTPVWPELLKIRIVDKVYEHAKRLGYTQTPTLNASISGNLSLATRRAALPANGIGPTDESSDGQDLSDRIAALRKIPDILASEHLESMRDTLINACKERFCQDNEFGGTINVRGPMLAQEIPEEMHPSVVSFALRQGLKARHELIRWLEPITQVSSMLEAIYPTRKRKVEYYISQPSDLPKTAAIIEIVGDSRCVPTLEILIYVIPL